MLESYWEAAYRSGRVPWDPGPYDGHLPQLLVDHAIEPPGPALDIGCGEGKSALYLARRGFEVLGIDIAPTAISRAQTLIEEERSRPGEAPSGTCRFALARFPDDLPALAPEIGGEGGFPFIMERGLLQHMRSPADHEPFLQAVGSWLTPAGRFYALIAKREGARRFAGPPPWSRAEVERAFRRHLRILELRGSVFTPGERGSIPAWVVVAERG
jgi:SAM-dependent methyltransferase